MPRRISSAQMQHLRRDADHLRSGFSVPMQPVISEHDTNQLRPVPSLQALEQIGGPELDGPIELPDREVWSSRINGLLSQT